MWQRDESMRARQIGCSISREITLDSPEFRETERRLQEWGRAARRYAEGLGFPSSSAISRMIEQAKVHDLSKPRAKPWKRSKLVKIDPNADAEAVSREMGHSEPEHMRARETISRRFPTVEWDSAVLQMENVVKQLDKTEQQIIRRSYLFRQCDRDAARQLRMPKERYRNMREAAVIRVAEKLAMRGAFRYLR